MSQGFAIRVVLLVVGIAFVAIAYCKYLDHRQILQEAETRLLATVNEKLREMDCEPITDAKLPSPSPFSPPPPVLSFRADLHRTAWTQTAFRANGRVNAQYTQTSQLVEVTIELDNGGVIHFEKDFAPKPPSTDEASPPDPSTSEESEGPKPPPPPDYWRD